MGSSTGVVWLIISFFTSVSIVVGIKTGLWFDSGHGQDILSSPNCVDRLWIPPQPCIQSVPGVEGPIPGGKAACT